MKKKTDSRRGQSILFGTLVLTLAGIITRILGFIYKIYLSNVMTEENLGLYQLIFPVYGLCFTIYASGIQTAISQLVANHKENRRAILRAGILLSGSIALLLSILLWQNAGFVAEHFLREASCEESLRILSVVFPCCGLTACINGYYYGLKKTACPSSAQLLEQVVRIASVYALATLFAAGSFSISTGLPADGPIVTCEFAVIGIALGELASNILCLLFLITEQKQPDSPSKHTRTQTHSSLLMPLLSLALPLTATRLIVNLLHSMESILIPSMLQNYGLTSTEALSIYGVLTGMAMSFITFPSAITSAFSLLLLPAVSEAQAAGNQTKIQRATEASVKYCMLIGMFSTCVFLLFGKDIGQLFFHNESAGTYITILAWLCPFLYLSSTLGSIINGLGKTYLTFVNTIASLAVRILFLALLVPKLGINGYLLGMLVSQLLLTFSNYFSIKHYLPITFDALHNLLIPGCFLLSAGLFTNQLYRWLLTSGSLPGFALLILLLCGLLLGFFFFLIATRLIGRSDFRE